MDFLNNTLGRGIASALLFFSLFVSVKSDFYIFIVEPKHLGAREQRKESKNLLPLLRFLFTITLHAWSVVVVRRFSKPSMLGPVPGGK